MTIKFNPNKCFADFAIKSDQVNNENKHILNDQQVIFKASKKNLPYYDHIETSNTYSSLILSYGANKNKDFIYSSHMVFPTFRRKINDTRGSASVYLKDPLEIKVDEKVINEKLSKVILNGMCKIITKSNDITLQRMFYCASNYPGVITSITFTNNSNEMKLISIDNLVTTLSCGDDYDSKPYHIKTTLMASDTRKLKKHYEFMLDSKQSKTIYFVVRCRYDDDSSKIRLKPESNYLLKLLDNLTNESLCSLNSEDEVINTMHSFSIRRTLEAIFDTKGGLMHCPCGGQYYAGIWTNDQLEYAAPLFAYLNDNKALMASINAFRLFEQHMYKDEALISSIVAEGDVTWNGAGDRGDASMYLYAITRFLLTLGNVDLANYFKDAIKWCIDYSLSKQTQDGLIESDSDELENRFESGKVNLATNTIFYQGLKKAAILFNELGIENDYDNIANTLKDNINKYFYVDGKCLYCKEESHLRSHVVYPLVMGIYDHADDIIKTIMDPSLYTKNGFKTIDNCETYWDRITLMAIRGLFNANQSDLAYKILKEYSENRLLKDHVPYAIEAYPEGNQAHLAAESALYARIALEGILGFEPMGFNKFKLHLSMPSALDELSIENVMYNDISYSIQVCKDFESDKYLISIPELDLYLKSSNYDDIMVMVK